MAVYKRSIAVKEKLNAYSLFEYIEYKKYR
jgi:hypothetical protein